MGVGGVTVISGGNLVTVDGMKSFGMLGGIRERILLGSGSLGWSLLVNCCCWSEEEQQTGSLASRHRLRLGWEVLTWARLRGATRGRLFLEPAGCCGLRPPLRHGGQFHLLAETRLLLSVRDSLRGLLLLP